MHGYAELVREPAHTRQGFRHEALVYAGEEEFLAGTVPFIRDAVAADEPILVAVSKAKGSLLRSCLGNAAAEVSFVDMAAVGRNPARIFPVWLEFVRHNCLDGQAVRGIGELIWPDRSPAELVECQHHESLLNLAFPDRPALWLLCPYDAAGLDPRVIDEARRSHPVISEDGVEHESPVYTDPEPSQGPCDDALPEPGGPVTELRFVLDGLAALRQLVGTLADEARLDGLRKADLVLAVNELATNSICHAGGEGAVRLWREADALICEVRDTGHIVDPLVGRRRPTLENGSGYGMWLVNQVCDLVQIRSRPTGTVVRLRMSLD
jgi:anti-sigma regulatory factor (Ser/Thr protein kinase)